MKKNSLLIFGLALLVTLGLYLFLPTKSSKLVQKDNNQSKPALNLEQYRADFIRNQSDSLKLILNEIEVKVSASSDSQTKVNALTSAIQMYNDIGAPLIAANFVFEKAKLISHTNSWEKTGDNFVMLLSNPSLDTSIIGIARGKATESYQNSIALDSNNMSSKMKLAQCLIEFSGQPMQGVQMLLGIVRKDSNNVDAQLLLAKFGLVSGQIEKVLKRLEKVLSLQPQNIDALLMRAEAYARSGKNELAIADLDKVKNNAKTPEMMKQQLEQAIKDLAAKK